MSFTRRTLLAAATLSPLATRAAPLPWPEVLRAARGQTVLFNAWDGDGRTNAFIAWAAERMRMEHDIGVRHVRLSDTGEAVAHALATRAAERNSADLLWVNPPDLLAMRQRELLFAPVLDALPNAALVDRTMTAGGYEVPWRMARFVFLHDVVRTRAPPRRMADMVAWATARPGRLTHPTARDLLGATFLMQAMLELAPNRAALARPAGDAAYAAAASPLWRWYAALRPHLWQGGRDFPATGAEQVALFAAGALDVALSFNPAEAANGIAHGVLPPTTRAFVPAGGTLGHCSFVAIPEGAVHRAGAMVLADFLLSPEAQAHAADPRILGSPTVLDLSRLSPADRALFQAPADMPGLLPAATLGTPLPEPHPSWLVRVAAEWERAVLSYTSRR